MAIKINVPIHTKGGVEIPAGAIACFVQTIPLVAMAVEFTFSIHLNAAAITSGKDPIEDIDGIAFSHRKDYDAESFSAITQGEIETEAKVFMETFVGSGNCEIITRDTLQRVYE